MRKSQLPYFINCSNIPLNDRVMVTNLNATLKVLFNDNGIAAFMIIFNFQRLLISFY